MENIADWVSAQEAADKSGISKSSILKLCNNGGLVARKFSRTWAVYWPSVVEYQERMAGLAPNDPRRNPAWERSPEAGRKRKEEE